MFDTKASYYSTEELWFPESEFQGSPTNSEMYHRWSPSNFVDKWETPTLVIHGEKDYRLSITEGISTFTALQRMGVPSRFLYFPTENHWVLQPANVIQWFSTQLEWVNKWTAIEPDIQVRKWRQVRLARQKRIRFNIQT